MASIQKTAYGYRAQIKFRVHGKIVRDSGLFPNRRDAQQWAVDRERELKAQSQIPPSRLHTLRDAMRRYAEEISPTKRGAHWEQVRLAAFEGYHLPLDAYLADVTAQDIAEFRDTRLAKVSAGSVRREICILSSVFEMARLEWGWADHNPCRDIRKPANSKSRDRVLYWHEIRAMLREMSYSGTLPVQASAQSLAICMLLALRTGMRAGELAGMQWNQVHEDHVHLPQTKSGRPRDVPLSSRARRLIQRMRGWHPESVFDMDPRTLSTLFRRYRERAGLSGFTFHDCRHTAATMMSRKVDVLDLCKIFGWTDPKMAMVYYNPHARTLAERLG
ncbi:MAG: site-specific integrase [Castellaniella sp.]